MPRGGYRWDGNSNWNTGKTGTIRVPLALHKQLLEIAHALDNGHEVIINEDPTIDPLHIKRVTEITNKLVECEQRQRAIAELMVSYQDRINTSPRWTHATKLMEDIAKVIPWKQLVKTFKPLLEEEGIIKASKKRDKFM